MWESIQTLCCCPKPQQDVWEPCRADYCGSVGCVRGWHRVEGKLKVLYLNWWEPLWRGIQKSGFTLFDHWIQCISLHGTARWEGQGLHCEAKKQVLGSQTSLLVLVQWCWAGGDQSRAWKQGGGGGFNCEAGCTFHSALCQAGSWRCSGGRTTWPRRRQEVTGHPWPHNPESWKAGHPLYHTAARWWPTAPTSSRSVPDPH